MPGLATQRAGMACTPAPLGLGPRLLSRRSVNGRALQRQTTRKVPVRKSLNLCEATESFGGCLEVIRTFPLAARNNPRSAARRRQTLPTAACPAVFHFRDCERC